MSVANFLPEWSVATHTDRQSESIVLSSCEAEYMAMTTSASEGFFSKNCTGRKGRLELRCASSSARAICHRQGVGRVRLISCGILWSQGPVQKGEVAVKPVGTWRSTADPSTKIKRRKKIKVLLNLMGYVDTGYPQ